MKKSEKPEYVTDVVSRRAVIDLLWYFQDECCSAVIGDFEKLPSAPPETFVFCKDCEKQNHRIGDCINGHWIWKPEACPLAEYRGPAQGHEFDYQFCSFGKPKESD